MRKQVDVAIICFLACLLVLCLYYYWPTVANRRLPLVDESKSTTRMTKSPKLSLTDKKSNEDYTTGWIPLEEFEFCFLDSDQVDLHQEELEVLHRKLEQSLTSHKIIYAKSCLEFFKRLGRVYIMLIRHNNQPIGRFVLIQRNFISKDIWYIADLRILPAYQGQGLGSQIQNYLKNIKQEVSQVYGICMEPYHLPIVRRLAHKDGYQEDSIYLYALDKQQIQEVEDFLGVSLKFNSLQGIKDVYSQENSEIPILHYSPIGTIPSQEGYNHLFCVMHKSKLHNLFDHLGCSCISKGILFFAGIDDINDLYISSEEI